nr:hypothetical protein [Mucispirillum sp.]
IDDTEITIEAAAENGICFSWVDNANHYLLSVMEAESCTQYEIQDKLEIVFNNLFDNSSSELYAARNVIIDDMYGLEVLGGNEISDNKYDIFYGLYLTDGKDGYVITGFGDDEVEFVFEKLTGAARLFYRKDEPALINKGKSQDKEIYFLRKLSSKLMIDYDINWQILNCTFTVVDGRFDIKQETSFLMLSENGVEEMDFSEIYKEDKSFINEINELLSNISAYDISGFTVTLFKDGRYGITYYPVEEDEFDDENCQHKHYYDEDNDYFPEYGNEKEYALNYINKLHSDILSPVDKWDNGMVLIQNTENWTMVYPYYNKDKSPFIEVNIIEDILDDISDESYMEELGSQYGKYYPAMYDYFGEKVDELNLFSVLFYFKNNGENQVDLSSLAYKEFVFDIFCAVEDGDESVEAVNLIAAADVFEQEFANKPLMYISFDVSCDDNSLSLCSKVTGLSINGEEVLDNNIIKSVLISLQTVFDNTKYCNGNTVGRFTIFPNGKIGVQFI